MALVQPPRHTACVLDARTLGKFRERFGGGVVTPDGVEYGEARRVWNGMIDRYPAVVAQCANDDDVAHAIELARNQGVPLAVRGGGHSAAGFGTCDGGVVIDLGRMRLVEVDPARRETLAGGGATWADVDRATQAHGLAVTGGLVTHTGIGGLTLGGGLGSLMRRCGLTCDNLVGADVVTADGGRLHVTADENPELFWGLRGGGGNFGVVTRFHYTLHDVGPTVLAGALIIPIADATRVLRFYREWASALPDAMTTVVALRSAPPAPFIPAELHGRPVMMIALCWSGDPGEGERTLEPLRQFARPLVDRIGLKPYLEHQSMFDASAPSGRFNYKRNANLPGMPDALIDTLVEHTLRSSSPHSMVLVFQLGGAVSRVAEGATAYGDRGAAFNVDVNAQWLDAHDPRAEEHMQWARDVHDAVLEFSTGGAYVNFLMGDEGHDGVRRTYGVTEHHRLLELKRQYDPSNVFRLNHNIHPDGHSV